jgi:hypothetical protein
MVRGKKNFLPPTQLVVGFGFLFRIDDSCIEKHCDERRPKVAESTDEIDMPVEDEEIVIDNEEEEQIDCLSFIL